MKRIAIVGGGISGLSAAVTLERARSEGAQLEYVIFEAAPRLGGVLVTEQVDGCTVEAGPDSFLTEKSWGLDFVRELGLGDQLIGSNDAERKTYILVRGRLVPIPDGLQFMVPTQIAPILTTPLFSVGAKLRMATEYLHKPNPNGSGRDETVAEMVERHFGPEMVDRLADPLLAGVYGGEAAKLSAAAVLPRFVEMEKKYGSLSRGMLRARKQRMQAQRTSGGLPSTPPPLFTSLKSGMQQLVDAIVPRLAPESVRTGRKVAALGRRDDKWWVAPQEGSPEEFDAVILALQANQAGVLLERISGVLSSELAQIPYSSSITATLGYNRADLRMLPPGFGFLVPRSEGRRLLACTFVHVKFPHRAPADRGLIRAVLGGSRDPEVLNLGDDEILRLVRQNLMDVLGLKVEPRFVRMYRWRGAMAQYVSGHNARIQRIEELRRELPGLELAGNAYRGIGVPDCIASGRQAATQALARLFVTAEAKLS